MVNSGNANFKSLVINILLGIVVGGAVYTAINMLINVRVAQKEGESVEAKREELTRKKKKLEAYVAELQRAEAVEREAKDLLNLKKPGENVVVVVPEEKKENSAPLVASAQSWWSKIKAILWP